jgi:hypothetical protein
MAASGFTPRTKAANATRPNAETKRRCHQQHDARSRMESSTPPSPCWGFSVANGARGSSRMIDPAGKCSAIAAVRSIGRPVIQERQRCVDSSERNVPMRSRSRQRTLWGRFLAVAGHSNGLAGSTVHAQPSRYAAEIPKVNKAPAHRRGHAPAPQSPRDVCLRPHHDAFALALERSVLLFRPVVEL